MESRAQMMWWMLTVVVLALPVAAAGQEPSAPKGEKERLSYALGVDLGNQFKQQSVEVDPTIFARGLADAMGGGRTHMTEAEVKAAIGALQAALKTRQTEAAKAAGEKNKAEGEAFLAANKAKDGVVTLPSGLQYKVLTAGTGKKPTIDDTVVCHYRGTLVDGREFDSSYGRQQPATFPVKGVIKGWTEVLQLMPVGSKWQVFIPSNLAYGERGAGNVIGPMATLVFEIELVAIK